MEEQANRTVIKKIMFACGLTQKQISELMGVPLQRVKCLTSQKSVKNLTRDECRSLIEKLNIHAEFLLTGDGEIFNKDISYKELATNAVEELTRLRALTLEFAEKMEANFDRMLGGQTIQVPKDSIQKLPSQE